MMGQSLVGVNAVSENAQNNRGEMEGLQCERQKKESSWVEMNQRTSRQEEKKCSSGIQKDSNMVRCTFLNGSVWSTEKKYMRRHKDTFAIYFTVEHRMRKEEMEEQFNKETKHGWRLAADAARITDENTISEVSMRTSGGVFCGSPAIWEQSLPKKEQSRRSQGMKRELTKHGSEKVCGSLPCVDGSKS